MEGLRKWKFNIAKGLCFRACVNTVSIRVPFLINGQLMCRFLRGSFSDVEVPLSDNAHFCNRADWIDRLRDQPFEQGMMIYIYIYEFWINWGYILEPFGKQFGCHWEPFGSHLGGFGVTFGSKTEQGIPAPFWSKSLLRSASETPLGPFWDHFGASQDHFWMNFWWLQRALFTMLLCCVVL